MAGENKQLNENGEYEVKVGTEHLKCSACGGNMVFDPDKQMLFCEHCGTTQIIDGQSHAVELDLNGAFFSDSKWESDQSLVFTCDNCGAKVVLNKNETAKECPFCGTGHVQETEALSGIKPNAVIPFKLGLEKAIEITKNWARKKFFAPRNFKKNLKTENVKGVYTPCFTFDSKTSSTYVGRIGKTHTRVVGSGKNRRTETYTVWRNISGTYFHNFNDILVSAGEKVDQGKLEKMSPFDTENSKTYEESFLLGFMAYHYDKEVTDMWAQAKGKMDVVLRKLILSQYSYDKVSYLNVSTCHEGVTYKYVMLPVYVGNFNYRSKLFNFYVNGETGKVIGKTPKSPWKILITVLLSMAVVAGSIALFFLLNS